MYCLGIDGPANSDYNKRLILLSVIHLSGGHCIFGVIWGLAISGFDHSRFCKLIPSLQFVVKIAKLAYTTVKFGHD